MSQQSQRNDDQNIIAVAVLFGTLIVLLFLVFTNQPVPAAPPEALAAVEATAVAQTATAAPPVEPTAVVAGPTPETVAAAPAGVYTVDKVAAGQRIYSSLCFACHGQGGIGVTGLGKPLVNSEFVDSLADDELVQFLIVGRQPTDPLNTTGQLMPARGGNPALTDEDLYHTVAYIRSLNGAPVEGAAAPAEGQPTEVAVVKTPTAPEDWVAPPINALDGSVVASNIVNPEPVAATTDGSALYAWYCAACHGPAGEGVNGESALVGMAYDYAAFAETLTAPAPLVAPAENVFVHAYRGGAPELTDEQIAALVEFLQGLGG